MRYLPSTVMSRSLMVLLSLLIAGRAPAQVRRDEVVVVGSYEPVAVEESDRPVRTLDAEKQRLLSSSPVDLLQLDPSIDLRQRAPAGVQSDISIRGGTYAQTLVLLDGLRLNDVQTGHFNLDLPVPTDSVSRIEVLHGSGSTLYGSDAVGGAVNFVTRPPEAAELRVRTAAGNFGVNQQRVSLSAVRGRWAQLLAASRDFSSGFIPNRDYRNLSLTSNSTMSTGWGSTSLLLAHNDRPFGADNFYGSYPSWERTKTWFGSARQELGERTAAAFAFRRHSDLFVLYRDRPEVFTNRHTVESYQGALRRREDLGRNARLHYGVETLHDSIASNNLGFHSRWSGAAYAALDFRALGRYSFSAGIREQIFGGGRSTLSPTIGAGAWVSGRLRLKGSVSRAFRLPSYTELYYHDPVSLGSPGLRPERAWSFDGGLEWHAGRGLQGDVTVFHRRESDGIDFARKSESDIWRAANIQRLRFNGVETGVTARVARSHQIEVRYTGLQGSHTSLNGMLSRYVFNYPSHSGVVAWHATMPGGLLGRVRVAPLQRVGADMHTVVDGHLALGGRRVRPFLQLTNLTNSRYEDIPRVPMPGRAIVGGIELVAFGP